MSLAYSLRNIKNRLFTSNNNAIIHNKYILYFILFICLADLLILSVEQDFISISIFFLIVILTTYFSKNMLIILFIAVTFTNIIKYGTKIRSEGFKPADENDVKEKRDKDAEEIYVGKDEDEKKEEKKDNKKEEKKEDKKEEKKEEEKEKEDDDVKSDKYKENVISKFDNITMEDASDLFSKLSKIVNAMK